jgi:hypothetical protein
MIPPPPASTRTRKPIRKRIGSTPKYWPSPPATPPSTLSEEERVRRRGSLGGGGGGGAGSFMGRVGSVMARRLPVGARPAYWE